MRARKRAYRGTIEKLKRENEEQLDTIRNLLSNLKPQFNMHHSSVSSSHLNNADYTKKINELEAILAKKREKFSNLKRVIADYLQKAEMFEEQLINKEKENELLLLSIQRMADSQPSELTLSQLESMRRSSASQAQKISRKSISSSNKSHHSHSLKSTNSSINKHDSHTILKEILDQKRATVLMLRNKLNDAYKVINNLEADARILRNVIKSSSENNTEQY